MLKTVATSAITGALSYQGTWNANTNVPTLTSSVGTQNWYYVVSTAGNTTLNGVSNWNIGDWAIFNGSVWEKVDGSSLGTMAYQNANAVAITGGTINTTTINTGTFVNANITSVSTTFPNSYLANSSATVGNTVVTLGSTVSAIGNVTLNNVTITSGSIPYANVTGLGTMATQNANNVIITGGTINTVTETSGVYANANITSVAKTFPNTYLANSTATLGNATITLGSTTTSVGNLTLANAIISSGNVSANVSGSTGIPVANSIGTLAVSNGGTGLTSFTANGVVYASSSSALSTGSNLSFNGTNLSVNGKITSTSLAISSYASNTLLTGNGNAYIDNFYNSGTGNDSLSFAVNYDRRNASVPVSTLGTAEILFLTTTTGASSISFGIGTANTAPSTRMNIFSSGGVSIGNTTDPGSTNLSVTGSLTLGNALSVANGGTGLTTLTSGYVPYGNGTSALSSSSNLSFDGTNLTVNGKVTIKTLYNLSGVIDNVSGTQNIAVASGACGILYVTGSQNGVGQVFYEIPFIYSTSGPSSGLSIGTTRSFYQNANPISSVGTSGGNVTVTCLAANTFISYSFYYLQFG